LLASTRITEDIEDIQVAAKPEFGSTKSAHADDGEFNTSGVSAGDLANPLQEDLSKVTHGPTNRANVDHTDHAAKRNSQQLAAPKRTQRPTGPSLIICVPLKSRPHFVA
jgi:hypothetical protein